jgi:hypothetical protein
MLGITDSAISRWVASGRLHRVHRRVYAVGHRALSLEGRLHAALLYAGRDSALSHTTAAWIWQLIAANPRRIHVSVPNRRRSLPEVRVHERADMAVVSRSGFSVTTVARTLVDLGTMLSSRELRRAVAEADYRGLLHPAEVRSALRRGRAGSRALRRALEIHLPRLAETLSVLEERFLELCESAGLPQPEVNARVGGIRVDALWRDQHLAVELDGGPAHGGIAAMKRDRDRGLFLRSAGFQVVRYSWEQVVGKSSDVTADLRRLLNGAPTGPPAVLQ